jgi:hypothetical protein
MYDRRGVSLAPESVDGGDEKGMEAAVDGT